MFISIRFYAFIAALFLLWVGEERIRSALANRELVTMKAADYVRAKPDAKWLELTDCFPSLMEAVSRVVDGKVKDVFIPIRALGDDGSGDAHVILASRDDRFVSIAQQLMDVKETEAQVKIVNDNNERGVTGHSFRGLVRHGADLASSERHEIESLQGSLTSDFVILDHDTEPSLTKGILAVAGGFALLMYTVRHWVRSRASAAPAA